MNGTKCRAHTRAYKGGDLVAEGFDVEEVSDYLDSGHVIWLDLEKPGIEDLQVITEELSLHHLAVEDAVAEHQRPKLDSYEHHLFLSALVARLDEEAVLTLHEVDAFITDQALVTVRKSDSIGVEHLTERWDATRKNAASGVSFLLHGLLDLIVDGHFATA